MKAKGILLLLTFVINGLWASDSWVLKKTDTTTVFVDSVIIPEFQNGGEVGMMKFIGDNFHYPNGDHVISGTVVVNFLVDVYGNTKDVVIRRGLSKLIDAEAIRIVRMMKFTPGSIDGKLEEIRMTLPIKIEHSELDEK